MFDLTKILKSLRDTESPFDDGTGEFQQVNIESAKRNLDLSNRARENGEAGIPAEKGKSKDGMAVEIDSYMTQVVSIAKDKLVDRLRAIHELSTNQNAGNKSEIVAIFESGSNDLWASAKDYYNDLFHLRRSWILGEVEFAAFRKTHNRIGPARSPDKAARNRSFGLLFMIFTLEIVLNAWTLGSSHSQGPVGVILEIFLFGAVNLGLAFILGFYIWPYFNHIKVKWRRCAACLTMPIICILMVWNVFIGHYRDALAKFAVKMLDFESALQAQASFAGQAVHSMLQNPVMLDDFKSYLIMSFGLLAAIVVVIKAYSLDDPYPGYGKINRYQADLAQHFNANQTAYLRDINELTDDYVDQLNGQIAVLEGQRTALKKRSDDQSQLIEKYKNWLSTAEESGKALYAYYREENLRTRSQKKVPEAFLENTFQLPSMASNVPEAKIIEVFDISEIKSETAEMAKKLNLDLRYYQDKFKDLTNLSQDQALQDDFSDTDLKRPN